MILHFVILMIFQTAFKKGGWPAYNLVKTRFRAKQHHSRTDLRSIEVWYRKGLKQLKQLEGADKISMTTVSRKD